MKKLLWSSGLVLVFVMTWTLGVLLRSQPVAEFQSIPAVSCQPIAGCLLPFDNTQVQIEFVAPVSVMKPFTVILRGPSELEVPRVQFRMRDMEMGDQQHRLSSQGSGVWQSDVILPVCTLGRTDWQATLEFVYQGVRWRTEFEFVATP